MGLNGQLKDVHPPIHPSIQQFGCSYNSYNNCPRKGIVLPHMALIFWINTVHHVHTLVYKSNWISISLSDLYHVYVPQHMHFPG